MPEKSLKWYHQLADKKGRLEAGSFLVEGEKAIRQIVASNPEAITEILSVSEPPPLFSKYPIRTISASQFRYISSVQTPQGIIAVVKSPDDIYSPNLLKNTGKHILLLEDIQDPVMWARLSALPLPWDMMV